MGTKTNKIPSQQKQKCVTKGRFQPSFVISHALRLMTETARGELVDPLAQPWCESTESLVTPVCPMCQCSILPPTTALNLLPNPQHLPYHCSFARLAQRAACSRLSGPVSTREAVIIVPETSTMSRSPSKLPISSSTHYSSSPALQSDIASALTASRGVRRVEATLRHSLQSSGWTDNLRTYCLDLLRRGECSTYDELMARIVKDSRPGVRGETDGKMVDGVNGNAVNGDADGHIGGPRSVEEGGVQIPQSVVKEGLKVVRNELEEICEVVD